MFCVLLLVALFAGGVNSGVAQSFAAQQDKFRSSTLSRFVFGSCAKLQNHQVTELSILLFPAT
jgi:hypothetical protein